MFFRSVLFSFISTATTPLLSLPHIISLLSNATLSAEVNHQLLLVALAHVQTSHCSVSEQQSICCACFDWFDRTTTPLRECIAQPADFGTRIASLRIVNTCLGTLSWQQIYSALDQNWKTRLGNTRIAVADYFAEQLSKDFEAGLPPALVIAYLELMTTLTEGMHF